MLIESVNSCPRVPTTVATPRCSHGHKHRNRTPLSIPITSTINHNHDHDHHVPLLRNEAALALEDRRESTEAVAV